MYLDKIEGSATEEQKLGATALVWKLEVFLEKGKMNLGKKKYSITVECKGTTADSFNFKAHDASGGLKLNSQLVDN